VTLLSLDVEHAVRYTLPGETEERIEAVGSEHVAAELLDDLWQRHGVTGRYVARTVTAWQDQATPALPVRDRLERLAYRCLNGIVPDEHIPARLAELSPLPVEQALMVFLDLCEGVAALSLPWFEVVPDASGIRREEQAEDAARTRIDLALDALEGGAA
jgi:hypothetical protein